MEMGLSASTSFWYEVSLLERLLYKNKNQHRRTLHFQRLQQVHRLLSAVQTSSKAKDLLEPLMDCAILETLSIVGPGTPQMYHGLNRLLEQLLEAIRAASKALKALLAQSFFMPFALTVLACLAHIHSITSQAKRRLDQQSTPVTAADRRGGMAVLDPFRTPQKQTALFPETASPLSFQEGHNASMLEGRNPAQAMEASAAFEADACLRPEKRARLSSDLETLDLLERAPEMVVEGSPATPADQAETQANTPEETDRKQSRKSDQATDWLQDLGIGVTAPQSGLRQRGVEESGMSKRRPLQGSRLGRPSQLQRSAATDLFAGTDFEN